MTCFVPYSFPYKPQHLICFLTNSEWIDLFTDLSTKAPSSHSKDTFQDDLIFLFLIKNKKLWKKQPIKKKRIKRLKMGWFFVPHTDHFIIAYIDFSSDILLPRHWDLWGLSAVFQPAFILAVLTVLTQYQQQQLLPVTSEQS